MLTSNAPSICVSMAEHPCGTQRCIAYATDVRTYGLTNEEHYSPYETMGQAPYRARAYCGTPLRDGRTPRFSPLLGVIHSQSAPAPASSPARKTPR